MPIIAVCIPRSPLPQPQTLGPAPFELPIPWGTPKHMTYIPLGSAHRQPLLQRLQQLQHSSVETCCVDLHRQLQGWSALHSCLHGAPYQRGQGMGQVLPGVSSGQLLQGNMPCVIQLTIRSNLTSKSSLSYYGEGDGDHQPQHIHKVHSFPELKSPRTESTTPTFPHWQSSCTRKPGKLINIFAPNSQRASQGTDTPCLPDLISEEDFLDKIQDFSFSPNFPLPGTNSK